MSRREPPSVLLVESGAADAARIAAMLEEAGIRVTIASGGAAATTADATIVATRIDLGDPRRFVAQVRERLLSVSVPPGDPEGEDEAEFCIVAAKLACLRRRREAARVAGARALADSLQREISAIRYAAA